jgi:hypothetical protein
MAAIRSPTCRMTVHGLGVARGEHEGAEQTGESSRRYQLGLFSPEISRVELMWPIRGFIIACGLIIVAAAASAQVLPPREIPDPQLRELQQRHLADLKNIATAISAHSFPYGLYFSRTLDLSEREQK